MKYNANVEMPCGYKFKLNFEAGMMSMASIESDGKMPTKCPLHGKNCPPKTMCCRKK